MFDSFTTCIVLLCVCYAKGGKYQVLYDTIPTTDRVTTHNELTREWSNSICCTKGLKCCKRETDVQIRAVLVKCQQHPEPSAEELEEKLMEPPLYVTATSPKPSIGNCRKKIMLTIKLSTLTKPSKNNEYLIIDHVYDIASGKKSKILTPYVVKLKHTVVMQMYKLRFLHVVNSSVQEKVYNKHSANYTGCDTSSPERTCGRVTYKNKFVPYSEGFCCSCDEKVNKNRQPEPLNNYVEDIVTYSDPEFLLNGHECPKHLRAKDVKEEDFQSNWYQYENPKIDKLIKSRNTDSLHDKIVSLKDFIEFFRHGGLNKRHIRTSGDQERGGQNCADKFTPRSQDPDTYHESAHCLKFSNLWYSVYRLEKPELEHSILIQVFERYEDSLGHVIWKDLTGGKMIRIGTLSSKYEANDKILIKYSSVLKNIALSSLAINYNSALLLVPDGVSESEYKRHPEISGGPSEYLIVHNNQINRGGDRCNVAGVSYEAFAKQPNRCSKPQGTCLSNQPFALWQHDHQAEKLDNPIRRDPKTKEQYLVMNFPESLPITMEIEIKSDFNTILSGFGPAKITEVYIDSTYAAKTVITTKITNAGLVSGYFLSRMTNCPLEIPPGFNNIESNFTLIPPQHQHIFTLEIYLKLPLQKFHCSMEALNGNREIVAIRRILVIKRDRCFCTWHCSCVCVGLPEGLKCIPMSLQHYHAAGFRGSTPISSLQVHYTFMDEVLTFITHLIICVVLVLLMLGFMKGILGIMGCHSIGMFGLDTILDLPIPIRRYYESEIANHPIVYDCEGWPVHPHTYKRVRCINSSTELCLNIVFFFFYPITCTIAMCRRVRNTKPECECKCSCCDAFKLKKDISKFFGHKPLLFKKKRNPSSTRTLHDNAVQFSPSTHQYPCHYLYTRGNDFTEWSDVNYSSYSQFEDSSSDEKSQELICWCADAYQCRCASNECYNGITSISSISDENSFEGTCYSCVGERPSCKHRFSGRESNSVNKISKQTNTSGTKIKSIIGTQTRPGSNMTQGVLVNRSRSRTNSVQFMNNENNEQGEFSVPNNVDVPTVPEYDENQERLRQEQYGQHQ
ncbi:hypothetical protein FQA39_LY08440 [Lamprigera yunnana]|nr:hypothetical protein FQA39_LY08440 [Lamprigera yunnana]